MTESSIRSLSSRAWQHAMDAQHRKCNREHQRIPEAPQARCSAAGPLPSQPVGKLATTTTFWRRGMCLVYLGNSATLHLSVLHAHAVRAVLQFHFLFFHSFFIGFPTAIAKEANVRNSHFLGDPGAKTVLVHCLEDSAKELFERTIPPYIGFSLIEFELTHANA